LWFQLSVCRYPNTSFYVAKGLRRLGENSNYNTKDAPPITLITGGSRDGADLCDGFGLFRRSRYFVDENSSGIPDYEKLWRKRPPPRFLRTVNSITAASAGVEAVAEDVAEEVHEEERLEEDEQARSEAEECDNDPVQCSFGGEELEELSQVVGVPVQTVWDCEVKGPRLRADRQGLTYFTRMEEKWATVSRGAWPSIFAEDVDAALDPVQPLRPALERLAQHCTLLDRRCADETQFDHSEPGIDDTLHCLAVQRARKQQPYQRLQRRLREGWTHKKQSVCTNVVDGAYIEQAEHFRRFVKAHNANVAAMRELANADSGERCFDF
jgi:hypothetical protein